MIKLNDRMIDFCNGNLWLDDSECVIGGKIDLDSGECILEMYDDINGNNWYYYTSFEDEELIMLRGLNYEKSKKHKK